jgi:hypothetical protein
MTTDLMIFYYFSYSLLMPLEFLQGESFHHYLFGNIFLPKGNDESSHVSATAVIVEKNEI